MILIHTLMMERSICYEFIIISIIYYRLFLLFLSPKHSIIRDNLEISSVQYLTQDAKISGKRKRGAEKVQPGSLIMAIFTPNRRFDIPACIAAQFLEMNEGLVRNPQLVKDSEGFLGIFLVALDKVKKVLSTLKRILEYA